MRPGRGGVAAASTLAAALTMHTAWNSRHLRRAPQSGPGDPADRVRVSLLVPARDEAHRIGPCLAGLRAQDHPNLRVLVLDDGSSDGTGALVRAQVADDPRFEVVDGGLEPPPPGWLGKPWACHRLAAGALSDHEEEPDADTDTDRMRRLHILIFIDADVTLAPDAVGRIAALMHRSGLDLASPWPRQVATTRAERLVQPLLQWSWMTTLPLGLAERSPRPALTAANGQLLAITARAYRRSGGHRAVRREVLEDIALARAVKAAGGRASVTDGTDLASCRMYTSGTEVCDGYTKSLWAAFGSPAGAVAVTGLLTFGYALPPAAALLARTPGTRAVGAAGYAAAVVGRVLVARRTGDRTADSWSHPLAILTLDALTGLSWWRHRRGQLTWKARPVHLPDTCVEAPDGRSE